jgi:hypothetical protein
MPACLADELRKTPVPEIKRRIAAGDIVSAAEWSGQNVCFGAHCRLKSDIGRGPKSATSGLMRRSKPQPYSITSSARTSNEGGTVRPSALAVFMLMMSSNLVGCSTGRSAGLAPLRNLST